MAQRQRNLRGLGLQLGRDTASILTSIGTLGRVTGGEFRLYRWVEEWAANELGWKPGVIDAARGGSLEIRYLAGSQMCLTWHGGDSSGSTLVVVAHADHEGYRIIGVEAADDGTVIARATPVAGFASGVQPVGAAVLVSFEQDGSTKHCTGRIVSVGTEEIKITVDSLPEAVKHDPAGHVAVAQYQIETVVPATKHPHALDEVSAAYLDNSAGIAVALASFKAIVRSAQAVNYRVILTSGEEDNFVGMLAILAEEHRPGGVLDDAIVVVVDCSSVAGSIEEPLGAWARRVANPTRDRDTLALDRSDGAEDWGRCQRDVVSVRLGDKHAVYDRQVSRLLYQASLGVRAALARDLKLAIGDADELIEDSALPYVGASLGSGGEFLGGYCEAAVLAWAPRIAERLGRECKDPVSVGALAIPIESYRNRPRKPGGWPEAECTRVGALYSATLVLYNLAASFNYAPPLTESDARPRLREASQRLMLRGREGELPPDTILDEFVEASTSAVDQLGLLKEMIRAYTRVC